MISLAPFIPGVQKNEVLLVAEQLKIQKNRFKQKDVYSGR